MSQTKQENVLVIPRRTFNDCGIFHGFVADPGYLSRLFAFGTAHYMPRDEAERNPNFKQILPYTILAVENTPLVLMYVRAGSEGEKRLSGQNSVGVGGHINDADEAQYSSIPSASMDSFYRGHDRELSEELGVNEFSGCSVIGAVNDESNEVGTVHLGIVSVLSITKEQSRKLRSNDFEGDLKGHFLAGEHSASLAAQNPHLEPWSSMVLHGYTAILRATNRL